MMGYYRAQQIRATLDELASCPLTEIAETLYDLRQELQEANDTIDFLRGHVAELELRVEEDDARWSSLTISAAEKPA